MPIQPFIAQESLISVSWPRPELDEVSKVGWVATRTAREAFVRLWLTEGCPEVFVGRPALWEEVRAWVGSRLEVCPKDITVVGSARFGFSLARTTWGRRFGEQSDLDLAIASPAFFETVVNVFRVWGDDYRCGVVSPRNVTEKEYWEDNKAFGEKHIPRGFFDSNKLPLLDRYPVAQRIGDVMWRLKAKLDCTPQSPRIRRASARVYRDWASLVARVSLNLRCAAPAGSG
jgi:hypothetical protein